MKEKQHKFIRLFKKHWRGHLLICICFAIDTLLVSFSSHQLSSMVTGLNASDYSGAVNAFSFIVLFRLVALLSEFIGNRLQNRLQYAMKVDLRNEITDRTLGLSIEKFNEQDKQMYLNEQVNKMDLFSDSFLENLYNAVYFGLLVFFGVIVLGRIYLKLSMALLGAIILSFVMSKIYDKTIERFSNRYIVEEEKHTLALLDFINGFLDLYYNRVRRSFAANVKAKEIQYEKASCSYYIGVQGVSTLLYVPMFIADMAIFFLIVFGITNGEVEIGLLAAYLNIGGLILNSGESFFNCLSGMKAGLHALSFLEVPDSADLDAVFSDVSKITVNREEADGPLEFYTTGFSYKVKENVFVQIPSLSVEHGKKIFITGENGNGKSTTLKLFLKKLTPPKGKVFFKGRPIELVSSKELDEAVAYLPQDGYLFAGTVTENIFFDTRPDSARYNMIIDTCDLGSFIEQYGSNYLIDPGGTNLSGGEKQRILLARTLAQNKDIYILDEPFVNLNPQLVKKIESYFIRQIENTVIIVSHEIVDATGAEVIVI